MANKVVGISASANTGTIMVADTGIGISTGVIGVIGIGLGGETSKTDGVRSGTFRGMLTAKSTVYILFTSLFTKNNTLFLSFSPLYIYFYTLKVIININVNSVTEKQEK